MLAIKESKKMVVGVAKLGNVAGDVFEDGKVTWEDFLLLDQAYYAVRELMAINYIDVVKEFKDLDEREKDELVKALEKEFDIPQDKIEVVLEKLFELGMDFYMTMKGAVDVMKELKK